MTKMCHNCKFRPSVVGPRGGTTYCEKCLKTQLECGRRNDAKRKERVLRERAEERSINRPAVLMKYGNHCTNCGRVSCDDRKTRLEIHHINGDGTEERSSTKFNTLKFYRELLDNPVRPDITLLCVPCHIKAHLT